MKFEMVSRNLPAVAAATGLALIPIAVDGMTHLAIRYFSPRMPRKFSWAVSMLPAATVFVTYGLFNAMSGGLYVAYKVMTFFWVHRLDAWNPHPSIKILRMKYAELMRKVTFDHEPTETEVIEAWNDPETVRLTSELIELAANEMHNLYDDLRKSARGSSYVIKKMAEDLTSGEGPAFYYRRFCCAYTLTLLDIYRAVRGYQYVQCTHGETNVFNYYRDERSAQLSAPFFKPGTPQFLMKNRYNGIIDLFQPLMAELKKFPEERSSDVKRYRNWAVRDDKEQIGPYVEGSFHLSPDTKP